MCDVNCFKANKIFYHFPATSNLVSCITISGKHAISDKIPSPIFSDHFFSVCTHPVLFPQIHFFSESHVIYNIIFTSSVTKIPSPIFSDHFFSVCTHPVLFPQIHFFSESHVIYNIIFTSSVTKIPSPIFSDHFFSESHVKN